jgi:putative nucleotidyltransferase with HDIG domain
MSTARFRELPRSTRLYIAVIVCLGAATVVQSFVHLYVHNIGWTWTILALLTLVSGSATVNLPALPATVSVSETFVFTSVLLFGSAAGTLTVALDALIISFWSYRKGHPHYKILFNVCAVSLTLWIASHLYYALAPYGPLADLNDTTIKIKVRALLGPLLVFTVAYYAINTWLITFAIALERKVAPLKIWRENFVWIALNYFGGASVAALLVTYTHDLDYTFLVIIVPLLVVLYFTFSTSMGRVEDANRHLSELNSLYMSTIETLAMAIDAKDQITHGHIRRVQAYAVGLARSMGVLDEPQIRAIEAAALLHDMGKLAVPEYILNKPGPLTPAEFEKMKLHASVGADILSAIEFPYPVVPIVRHHHESWDGSGYPDKLAGSDIPIGARILSVVDCFDALTSDRPYRPRLSDRDAIKILLERRGSMYDPLVVDTFIRVHATLTDAIESQPTSPSSLRAIAEASNPASVLVEPRAARFEEIAASSDEMLTLFDLARSLHSSMTAQDTTDLIAKHLRRLVPSSACVFYMYDVDTDELVAAHASGEHAALIKGLRVPRGQRLSGWVAANRQTIRNSDPVLDLGESARAMNPRPRSCLSAPLIAGKTLVGVLSLYSSNKDAYSEDHERIIEVVALQVSAAILEAHNAEKMRTRSFKDETTGLPNLKHLIEFIEAQLSDADRRHPFCLVVVRFARASERVSDPGVEAAIQLVRRALRPADLLFRSGMDELAALLLNTDRKTATAITTRLQSNLATLKADGVITTAEVGLACGPSDAGGGDQLLRFARDRAHGDEPPSRVPPPEAIH